MQQEVAAPGALTQTVGAWQRSSLAIMALADLVQRKGLGLAHPKGDRDLTRSYPRDWFDDRPGSRNRVGEATPTPSPNVGALLALTGYGS